MGGANPEWTQEKGKQPFGCLLILVEKNKGESPDFVICESGNIERCFACIGNLIPANPKKDELQEQVRNQIADV
ncbi:hypothetical protein H4R24_000465, partial [Coemansia sp. RSA 988]